MSTFSYPRRTRTHAPIGLSFAVAEGERIGVVGRERLAASPPSCACCCGSTTPRRAGSCWAGAISGTLGFDQILRAQLAIVNQDTYLFHGSVEDNLRLGRPNVTAR